MRVALRVVMKRERMRRENVGEREREDAIGSRTIIEYMRALVLLAARHLVS